MSKAIQLVATGDLKKWCGRYPPNEQKQQCLSFAPSLRQSLPLRRQQGASSV